MTFLRSLKPDKRDALIFMNWINSKLRELCDIEIISLCRNKLQNLMTKLNFSFE